MASLNVEHALSLIVKNVGDLPICPKHVPRLKLKREKMSRKENLGRDPPKPIISKTANKKDRIGNVMNGKIEDNLEDNIKGKIESEIGRIEVKIEGKTEDKTKDNINDKIKDKTAESSKRKEPDNKVEGKIKLRIEEMRKRDKTSRITKEKISSNNVNNLLRKTANQ